MICNYFSYLLLKQYGKWTTTTQWKYYGISSNVYHYRVSKDKLVAKNIYFVSDNMKENISKSFFVLKVRIFYYIIYNINLYYILIMI